MEPKPLVIADLKPALKPVLITKQEDLKQLEDFFGRVTEFGFDTETNFVKTLFERRARTFQFGDRNEQYVVDLLGLAGSPEELTQQGNGYVAEWAKEFVRVVKIGLENPKYTKLVVNGQFDYEVARWCFGIRTQGFYDCLLAEKVIHTGRVRFTDKNFWGMEDMVKRYCNLLINKEIRSTFDLETPLTQDHIDYAALDTRLPFSIRAGQASIIENAKLGHIVYEVENAAIPAFGDMKIAGIKVSEEKWIKQVKAMEELAKTQIAALDCYFIPVVGDKIPPSKDRLKELEELWRNTENKELRAEYRKQFYTERKKISEWEKASLKWEGKAAINYGAPAQVLSALNKMGIVCTSTSDDVLKKLSSKPVVKALRDFRTTQTLLDKYGYNFLSNHIDPNTGRVHSSINQLGADTGRTSSKDPNIQNIPQESDKDNIHYRSAFIARPGYKIITRDYDGCELRLIAELSGEESWINAFNKGQDVHSMCAEMMYGDEWLQAANSDCAYYLRGEKCSCKRHKELRNGVKSVNFGVAYGAEAANLSEQLGITKDEAKILLQRHRDTFRKVHAMLNRTGEQAKANLEMRTIGGRRRLFKKPDRHHAKELVIKNFLEDGKSPKEITPHDITRKVNALWGNIEREGKNTPFQGSNADMAKVAMSYIWQELEPKYGAYFVNMVHDELVIECPENVAEDCDKFIGEMMEKAGALYVKSMTMTSGGNIADCWSKGD